MDTFSERLCCVDALALLFPNSAASIRTIVQAGRVARCVDAGIAPSLPRLLVSNVMLQHSVGPSIEALENPSWRWTACMLSVVYLVFT